MMPGINRAELLPPPAVGRWRMYERTALQVRRFAGLPISARLDPWALAASLGLIVVRLDQLPGVSQEAKDLLIQGGAWSGGATPQLLNGSHVILINPNQSAGRQAATLMEEISHILLGHRPTAIGAWMSSGRDYDHLKEEEAYAVGSAALLPYYSLKNCLTEGTTIKKIAARFGITGSLVAYRLRGLKLVP